MRRNGGTAATKKVAAMRRPNTPAAITGAEEAAAYPLAEEAVAVWGS
jgi:hypothetical protein